MTKAYFIAGTDTEVGKTHVSQLILSAAAKTGRSCLGLKPVAAGAERNATGQWENEDALALMSASTLKLPYAEVNPFCFPFPASPHIAAEQAGAQVSAEAIHAGLQAGLRSNADMILVEGAGGWRVPINQNETLADLAVRLKLPVVLVVGMRLGCINHALLTAEAIVNDGLVLAGWVANCIDADMLVLEDNIATLKARIAAPLIASIPNGADASTPDIVSQFNILF